MNYFLSAWRAFFLAACLGSALFAQQAAEALAPRIFRATAGESRTAVWRDRAPLMTAITSTRVTPPLEFPIRVEMTSAPEPPGLKFVIPPATPPGDYTVEVAGLGSDGGSTATTLEVTVDLVRLSPGADAVRPPVILLNGFQLSCTNTASSVAASAETFGQLASLLQADGLSVAFFNNCTYGSISIEQLAGQLGAYLAGLQFLDGTPVNQVDLVVHSMGGLIARAYLAGKGQVSGVFSPPANIRIRKLVTIATPHFGSFQSLNFGPQLSEMVLGNQFLWDLATWNQGQDDLRGVDALAIVGNAGTIGATVNASDGVVSLTSGSLGFAQPEQRTRIVPYCHVTPSSGTSLGMSCTGSRGIADIDGAAHLTAQITRSFLADTSAWQSIGAIPSQDPLLKISGGALLALKASNDVYFKDLTSVQFDNGAGQLTGGPSNTVASVFYTEYAAAGAHNFVMNHSTGQPTTGTATIPPGGSKPLVFKLGPIINSVQSSLATGLPGLTVAAGSTIVVTGAGFGNTSATQLSANGTGLNISQIQDQQITAFLPGVHSGLVRLTVSNANGQHTVNVMAAPASGANPPSISLSVTQLQFSYTAGGSLPASQGVTIGNAGGGTLTFSATSSVSWLTLVSATGALTVSLNPAGLSPGTYTGAISITAAGASNSPQTVTVTLTVNPASGASTPTGAIAHFAAGGSWTTGIFVINTGSQTAQFSISFYGDDGNPATLPFSGGSRSVLAGSVPANGSAYFEAGNPQGGLVAGWGQITADPSIVVQAIFRNNVNGAYYEAAVPSSSGGREFLIPFDATTFAAANAPFYTGFAIANLNQSSAAITCTARDSTGAVIPNAIQVPALVPLGHWANYLFPPLAGKRGTIGCVSNTNIAATALRVIGVNAFSSLPVIVTNPPGPSQGTTRALAHFAAGGTWTTGIFVLNTSSQTAQYSVSFFGDNGSPAALPFSGGSANTVTGTLPGNGSAYLEASNGQIGVNGGWGRITADPSIVVQALFRNNVDGTYYEAAVPSGSGSKQFTVPFDATTFADNGLPFYTGFAIANLDQITANVVCTARDSPGSVIPNAVAVPALNPSGHWANYLFPALAGKRGTIDCVSNTTVAATALRFIGTNAFSSLPVIVK